MDERYTRTAMLIGEEGVEKLRNASVVIAGLGGVGGYAFECLVRAGVGKIRVIDGDVFNESNLNRQILATYETIGMSKCDVAVERAFTINPDADIEAIPERITEENADILLDGEWDVIIDAIDTLGCKVALIRKGIEMGVPVISSMGSALHTDTTAVRTANIMDTTICPLAANLRKSLRDVDTSNVMCVYSVEKPITSPKDRDEHGKSVLGSMPTVPAVFGMTLGSLAIKAILSKSE